MSSMIKLNYFLQKRSSTAPLVSHFQVHSSYYIEFATSHGTNLWGITKNPVGVSIISRDNCVFQISQKYFGGDWDAVHFHCKCRCCIQLTNQDFFIFLSAFLSKRNSVCLTPNAAISRFDFSNSYIWFEFHNAPLAKDVSLLCDVSNFILWLFCCTFSMMHTCFY